MKPTMFLLLLATALAGVASAQEVPPANPSAKAQIHQFGIIRTLLNESEQDELLDLPGFVHRSDSPLTGTRYLDFSALYVIPPLMMKGPLTFDVTQGVYALPSAWYPYAAQSAQSREITWRHVLAGVQADGLETTHPAWMAARAVEAAATLKVYKPGPAGSQPDDEGTTEGDVFLFYRAPSFADFMIAGVDAVTGGWVIQQASIFSELQYPLKEENSHAWLAQVADSGEVVSRRLALDPKSTYTLTPSCVACDDRKLSMMAMRGAQASSASPSPAEHSTRTLDLRRQLNEAITGKGLRPDEAAAMAELMIQSVQRARHPVLIYFLLPEWINARHGLKVTGPAEESVRVFAVVKDLPG